MASNIHDTISQNGMITQECEYNHSNDSPNNKL